MPRLHSVPQPPQPAATPVAGDVPDGLGDSLRDVFGVLPDDIATSATSELLERVRGGAHGLAALPWVDFDSHGAVVRAGVTTLEDQSLRLVANPDDHPDIAALVRQASGSILVGQVMTARGGDRFYWYAPAPAAFADAADPTRLRGLAITLPVFAALVDRFDGSRHVTTAEKRMLFQLVAGLGPREAADADGVSFETKRAQVKSLCGKLDCGGQTDLVRRAMGQLVHLLHVPRPAAAETLVAETFARRHLPPSVRLSIHLLDHRRALRVFEVGPASGRPVLVAHGMLFPLLLLNAGAQCERLGIRLLVPLRSGYLDEQSAATLLHGTDAARDQDDVARYIARFGERVPLIGHSVGAGWALAFARRHPERVGPLILLSPNFLGDRQPGSVFASFLDGLRALAARPGVLRYVAWQFRKQFLDAKVLRQAWRRICGDSADDLAVLDGLVGAGPIYSWFEAAYRNSVAGAADDMNAASGDWRAVLADLQRPVTVVIGPADPIARDREALAGLSGVRVEEMPAGGHLVAASHSEPVWDAIVDALAENIEPGERP